MFGVIGRRVALRGIIGATSLYVTSLSHGHEVSLCSIHNPKSSRASDVYKDNSKSNLSIISGTAHEGLTKEIAMKIGVDTSKTTITRFADGEVSIQFNDNVRGHDVFIVQSCVAPVNDSVMELLLSISCARRSGARRVIAVIPYFGYKHHRRSSQISTKHQSRFLASGAMDFAKMLQEMGVDKVISVDLQRPGQGHEACFFDTNVPLESLMTMEMMVQYFHEKIPLGKRVVVVSPNAECFKKARKFQRILAEKKRMTNVEADVKLAAFFPENSGSGPNNTKKLELVGAANVKDADVIIVDDMIDTAGTLSDISLYLQSQGARNVYVSASHGLFNESALELIEKSPLLRKVVVTNTLPLPLSTIAKSKIEVLSIAPFLANVMIAEHFRDGGMQPNLDESMIGTFAEPDREQYESAD